MAKKLIKIKIVWVCPLYHHHKYKWIGNLCCKLQYIFNREGLLKWLKN